MTCNREKHGEPSLPNAKLGNTLRSPISNRQHSASFALSFDGKTQPIWKTTATLAVREFNRKTNNEKKKQREFRIHLLKYKTLSHSQGTRKASAVFASELEAHAHVIQFYYKLESKESQRLLTTTYYSSIDRAKGREHHPATHCRKRRAPKTRPRWLLLVVLRPCQKKIHAKNGRTGQLLNETQWSLGFIMSSQQPGKTQSLHREWSAKRCRRAMARVKRTIESPMSARQRWISLLCARR